MGIKNLVLTEYIELQHMDPDSWNTGIVASAVQSAITCSGLSGGMVKVVV
jgi:hypothetical protein